MRLCIVGFSTELTRLSKAALLSELDCSLDEKDIDEIHFVTHEPPPAAARTTPEVSGLWEYPARRVRLCRALFRLVHGWTWLPSWIAMVPARLCQDELFQAVLACDPDVVVVHGMRWQAALATLMHRRYPQWACPKRRDGTGSIGPGWRRFDPSRKVTIVLPTYNGVKYLRQSIESCLSQTFETIELIIVDDGSSDDVQGIVTEFDDRRLKYLRHDRNRGLSAALNTGFTSSTGEYLTWTSDDNYFADDAIERMVAFLQTYPEVDFVYASSVAIVEDARPDVPDVLRPRPPQILPSSNGVGPCFLYKRRVYEIVGDYDTGCFLAEDYDYWMRVARTFRMQRLLRPLYYYRFHADSLTGKHGQQAVAERAERVRQRNRG
jgi:GT2 family glycosyltransferase